MKQTDAEIFEEIKNSNKPLVLWGAEKCAQNIMRILSKNNIFIDAVFDNLEYSSKRYFNEFEILSFEKICQKYDNFSILHAFGNQDLIEKYIDNPQVINVYALFDINDFDMLFSKEFITENLDELLILKNDLKDEFSKKSLDAYIKSRTNSDWQYIKPFLANRECFPEFMNFSENETIVDCGAFTGDTLEQYYNQVGSFNYYYALEPNPYNSEKLRDKVKNLRLNNVDIIEVGSWNEKGKLTFFLNGDQTNLTFDKESQSASNINVDTIDNICKCNASFIKMDIEGAEKQAILGAVNTISTQRPKLAISVYHKKDDLISIPKIIKSLYPDYQFYFRLHHHLGMDAILYAVPL